MSYLTIQSGKISVIANSVGAVLHSIKKDGIEYLWQGDEKYWKEQDKNLFPYVGRLTEEKYLYNGKEYPMSIHGFCTDKDFEVENQTDSSVDLILNDSAFTYERYPFHFSFRISYSVEGNTLKKSCSVKNTGDCEMFFGLGSHPGFNVPLNGEGKFSDWYFEFPEESSPVRIGFDQTTYRLNDVNTDYPLENGKILRLDHSAFDMDAIVLQNMPKEVTLKSDKSGHSVTASYPDMEFLGLWHKPYSDAPYVCIEPWLSLPSHTDFIENIEKQKYLVHLPAGKEYTNTISFEIK